MRMCNEGMDKEHPKTCKVREQNDGDSIKVEDSKRSFNVYTYITQ